MKKIMILGDVHAKFKQLNALIKQENPNIILQCGDFGFWPEHVDLNTIHNGDTMIYWCDGNHENHDKIDELMKLKGRRIPIELLTNIFYCPRGSTLTLEDGRKILFMGGAHSMDKVLRTEGFNWFSQETISKSDLELLPDVDIDIVISHTTPNYFVEGHSKWKIATSLDKSAKALNYVFDKYNPKLWYFGHWHIYKTGSYKNCNWTCLNRDGQQDWWKWL
jgi:hypothetical protein